MPLQQLTRPTLLSRTLLFVKSIQRGLATVTDQSFASTAPPPAPYALSVSSKPPPAALKLKSGHVFHGQSFGAQTPVSGEAVFTTSLVGNYGVPGLFKDQYGLLKYFESDRVQCQGIVVGDYAVRYSHWNAVESLGSWCARHGVPGISGVDTRAIVHLLRDRGSTLAKLVTGDDAANEDFDKIPYVDPNKRNLVAEVSTKMPVSYNPFGDVKIGVVDCGVKYNILRSLVKRGAAVTILPHDFDFNKISNEFDGLFISNGPGNPNMVTETVRNLRTALSEYQRPIFGICMGNLLLGMAAGLNVYKLRFGNRGHNVPAVSVDDGKCAITSQNHGYALDDSVMPEGWIKYYVNANDGTNEGIRHSVLPRWSVQFHPEAKGGPQDTEPLFDEFIDRVRSDKLKRVGSPIFFTDKAVVTPTQYA
ncbi:11789_t:CDS:2 [Dentiscutata heterogama]|uniref:11789_t:CDS:1 n=1 Tax=Dentiscutata heterogama TaxID=1316150 RepID=A0ACA9KLG4_9GLOM|nr:11789_t:CDS:2 [Dentiscutata heterogama]